ncbi:MAG: ATP-binding protein [Terracidiphilus sp.]
MNIDRLDSAETIYYLDPPYLPSVRVGGSYEHEMNLEDHEELVGRLLNIQGMAVLSGYENATYAPLEAAGWVRKAHETQAYSSDTRTRRVLVVEGTRELVIQSQRAEHAQILASVSDTGPGFPPELAEQVFDPFFTTKPHGTGMGLRISRSIIESHGGRLWAAGSPGRGATFHFHLPAAIPSHR